MSLDFNAIKAIPILAVCGKYGIKLRFNGEWGSAVCPLPSHKQGERDKTFQVSVQQNYFKCWSASCNEKAGCKGGDVINFVALMENCSQFEAAKKIAEWFHIETKTAAPRMEKRPETPQGNGSKPKSQKDCKDSSSPSGSVNVDAKGYMADVDGWLDELLTRISGEADEAYRKRVHNGIKARLIESFRNGKRQSQGLPAQ